MAFNLPRYCLVFDRAVKVVPTEDGGARVLVYNAIRDAFEDPHPSLARYVFFPNDEAELVSGAEFNAYVEELRARVRLLQEVGGAHFSQEDAGMAGAEGLSIAEMGPRQG